MRKEYLSLKQQQIAGQKAGIGKRCALLEAKRKAEGGKKTTSKKLATKKPISKAEYLKLAVKRKAAATAAKKNGSSNSSKATAELAAAKKEYAGAQARLKKSIEAYKKSSGNKK